MTTETISQEPPSKVVIEGLPKLVTKPVDWTKRVILSEQLDGSWDVALRITDTNGVFTIRDIKRMQRSLSLAHKRYLRALRLERALKSRKDRESGN